LADTWYLWSDYANGGESERLDNGRKLIISRNIIPLGEKVDAKKLGVSAEEFDALKDQAVVRNYPLPEEMTSGYVGSPVEFVREQMAAAVEEATEQGSAEQDMLLRSYAAGGLFTTAFAEEEPPLPAAVEEVPSS
jgi:hypothetical protein